MTLALRHPMPLSDHIKPSPYSPPTREQIERARTMYGEGFTVSRILAATDMALGTLYYWLGGGPREEGGPLYPPIARRRQVVGRRRRPLDADRVSLAARLWRTAERQTRDIEERLARPGAASPERERDVRMLGSLVRTLRDLSGFDSGAAPDAQSVEPALAAARESMARKQLWRDVDGRVGVVRDMVRYLSEMRKIETLQAKRNAASARAQAEKTKAAADADETRRELARRIVGFVAARQEQQEGGAE
jgi:hypothetical protein